MVDGLSDSNIVRVDSLMDVFERFAQQYLGLRTKQSISRVASSHFQHAVVRRHLSDETRIVIGTDYGSSVMFEELRKQHPEVLRVLDASHPPAGAVRRLLAKDAAEVGVDVRNYDDYSPRTERAEAIISRELQLADRVLVASRFSAGLYEEAGVPVDKLHIVPYAAPSARDDISNDRRTDAMQLVFVGAISERKGITVLLRAMREVERRGLPVHLDILGKLAGGYQLPDTLPSNVTWRGPVSGGELTQRISRAHLLVLPSMCEGFGRVLLEALNLGAGIVATTSSGGPDLLETSPDAPIWILPTESRAEMLPDLLEELTTHVLSDGIDSESARLVARKWSVDKYTSGLRTALSRE